jgi:hypothetical protein
MVGGVYDGCEGRVAQPEGTSASDSSAASEYRTFDQARTNCMAAGNAVRPVVFEGMFVAIAFSRRKRLNPPVALSRLRAGISPHLTSCVSSRPDLTQNQDV